MHLNVQGFHCPPNIRRAELKCHFSPAEIRVSDFVAEQHCTFALVCGRASVTHFAPISTELPGKNPDDQPMRGPSRRRIQHVIGSRSLTCRWLWLGKSVGLRQSAFQTTDIRSTIPAIELCEAYAWPQYGPLIG